MHLVFALASVAVAAGGGSFITQGNQKRENGLTIIGVFGIIVAIILAI